MAAIEFDARDPGSIECGACLSRADEDTRIGTRGALRAALKPSPAAKPEGVSGLRLGMGKMAERVSAPPSADREVSLLVTEVDANRSMITVSKRRPPQERPRSAVVIDLVVWRESHAATSAGSRAMKASSRRNSAAVGRVGCP